MSRNDGTSGREKFDARKPRHYSYVVEQTELYRIVSDPSLFKPFEWSNCEDLAPLPVADESRMRDTGWASAEAVDELWAQKNRLDDLFDAGKGDIYYRVRDQQFPQDRKGSAKFANRAGDKLWQVHVAVQDGLFDPLPPGSAFFDICGGPGAFSQLLLEKFSELRTGYGMTLRVPMTSSNDYWYKALENHNRFHILWGADDQGDVYVPENLDSAVSAVSKERISVVVSDGGFKIQKLDDKHMENLQELFSGRIVLAEFTLCLLIASEQSHFVVKLFDSFSHLTVSLIYIATLMFEEVYIVKPVKSRIVNSERYLAAKRRKPDSEVTTFCKQLLKDIHKNIYDYSVEHPQGHSSPNSAVPIAMLQQDKLFKLCIIAMNNELAEKQAAALKQVMDAADTDYAEYTKREQRKNRFGSPGQRR